MTKNKRYKETLAFLFQQLPMFQRQGAKAFKKDLVNIKKLATYLENPHNYFPSIHIAGTNGKGTVSHIIASILQEYGLKVGLYTSPHYKDFRERIKINGSFIDEDEVVDFVERAKPVLDELPASFFELTVAMAFDHFRKHEVDIAVIETGLGGRLDSTNIIKPLISVITNISMDHTDMLGDTIQKIAGEKAGIIKSETPVVIGEPSDDYNPVFEDKALEERAPLYYSDDVIKDDELAEYHNEGSDHDPFLYLNIRTALAAIRKLEFEQLPSWNEEVIKRGVSNFKENSFYIGRWEKLSEKPLVLADSAHNEAGLQKVLQRLLDFNYDELHIVLGFVKDKTIDKILKLFPSDARYYFVKADIPRGLDAKELREKAAPYNLKGRTYVSVKNGLKAAKKRASSEDLIFVGGSIFVIAEII